MAYTPFEEDMKIIQKLGDQPNEMDGMSADELKAKFDEGMELFQKFFNETHIPELADASRLPIIPVTRGGTGATTAEGARENLGAMPTGHYGLGAGTGMTVTDCDEAILNGWYYNAGGAANSPGLFSQSAFTMLVTGYGTGYCVTQVAFSGAGHSAYPYLAVRKKVGGSWDEWEYLNAPIIVGTEYRTTQRYLGKPVYVMGVDCGALPNNTTKTITWNASGGVTPIDYAVVTSLGRVIIGTGYDDSVSQASPVVAMVSQYNIRLKTTIDFSANSATAWIKYIKN